MIPLFYINQLQLPTLLDPRAFLVFVQEKHIVI